MNILEDKAFKRLVETKTGSKYIKVADFAEHLIMMLRRSKNDDWE